MSKCKSSFGDQAIMTLSAFGGVRLFLRTFLQVLGIPESKWRLSLSACFFNYDARAHCCVC